MRGTRLLFSSGPRCEIARGCHPPEVRHVRHARPSLWSFPHVASLALGALPRRLRDDHARHAGSDQPGRAAEAPGGARRHRLLRGHRPPEARRRRFLRQGHPLELRRGRQLALAPRDSPRDREERLHATSWTAGTSRATAPSRTRASTRTTTRRSRCSSTTSPRRTSAPRSEPPPSLFTPQGAGAGRLRAAEADVRVGAPHARLVVIFPAWRGRTPPRCTLWP